MKKIPLAVSILVLPLAIAACGKKGDDPAVVNGGAVVATAPIGTIYPPPPGWTGNLQQYCASYGGQYNGTICSITQNSGNGWNFYVGSTVAAQVYAGQRVSASASGGTTISVGGATLGTGSVNVVSQYSGSLVFQRSGSFSIQSLAITTCFDSPSHAVTCP